MFLCPFCERELATDNYSCCCGAMNISCNHHGVIACPIVGMKGRHRIVKIRVIKPVGSMVRITAHKTEKGNVYLKKRWKKIARVENDEKTNA